MLSDACDVDWSIKTLDFYCLYMLVCYIMYAEDSQTTAYTKLVEIPFNFDC